MNNIEEILKRLEMLDFIDRGESYVESNYIVPLLGLLGYNEHKDYEAIVHGDKASSFKLQYPPVEVGAKAVKHYHPDYIPAIRKKSFWIIEAKSAKDVKYPFEYKYIVQGMQYCIHPEIRAEYMVLSNGFDTCVYEPYRAAFLDGNLYVPVLHFTNKELTAKWKEIFGFLSIENVRVKVEKLLIEHFEKLASSSLDKKYPDMLWNRIGSSRKNISKNIEAHCRSLCVRNMDETYEMSQMYLSSLSAQELHDDCFEFPVGRGKPASVYYTEKILSSVQPEKIFSDLADEFIRASIFRKEHIFIVLSELQSGIHGQMKLIITKWLFETAMTPLGILNRAEVAGLRLRRKANIVYLYPHLWTKIDGKMKFCNEMTRHIHRPTALLESFPIELMQHRTDFNRLIALSDRELDDELARLTLIEKEIDPIFIEAFKKLPNSERQLFGFETYGTTQFHGAFHGVLGNYKIRVEQ